VTALGKLFGATAFRLALAILVLSAVGSGVVLYIIAWQVESVVDKEIARTVDAEAKGLIDTFDNAGIRRLYAVIEARRFTCSPTRSASRSPAMSSRSPLKCCCIPVSCPSSIAGPAVASAGERRLWVSISCRAASGS
jgi:hypothetical protein